MTFIQDIMQSQIFGWVILPILIFAARVCDVTIGTLRIIYISRSKKLLAPILGFLEVSIWLLAISQIMLNINNIICFIAYAFGFALGNYVGIIVEEKLAMGTLIVRIFLAGDETGLKERLFDAGFGVTSIDGRGKNGNVEILFSVIKRKDLERAERIISDCNASAFYSVEEAKSVKQGIFPANERRRTAKARNVERRHVRPGK